MSEALRKATPEEQLAEGTRGAVDVHTREDLLRKLRSSYDKGAPLRVKMGFDPTAPDLHLGHTVPLERMRSTTSDGNPGRWAGFFSSGRRARAFQKGRSATAGANRPSAVALSTSTALSDS